MKLLERYNEETSRIYGCIATPTLYLISFIVFFIGGTIILTLSVAMSLDPLLVGKYGYFSVITAGIGLFAMSFGLLFEYRLDYLATKERQKRIESKLDRILEKEQA